MLDLKKTQNEKKVLKDTNFLKVVKSFENPFISIDEKEALMIAKQLEQDS